MNRFDLALRRRIVIALKKVAGLVVVVGLLTPQVAAAEPKTQVLTPPYSHSDTDTDGDCHFNPSGTGQVCEEVAEPSASNGTLHSRAHAAVPSPQIGGRSAAGIADATSVIGELFNSPRGRKGGTMNVTFEIEVLATPTATATSGDAAEVFLNASVFAGCDSQDCAAFATSGPLPLAVDDCPGPSCMVTSGCPCLGPGTHRITVTVEVPPDEPLDFGAAQVVLRARALLRSQTRLGLEEQPHASTAEASVRVTRIEVHRV